MNHPDNSFEVVRTVKMSILTCRTAALADSPLVPTTSTTFRLMDIFVVLLYKIIVNIKVIFKILIVMMSMQSLLHDRNRPCKRESIVYQYFLEINIFDSVSPPLQLQKLIVQAIPLLQNNT